MRSQPSTIWAAPEAAGSQRGYGADAARRGPYLPCRAYPLCRAYLCRAYPCRLYRRWSRTAVPARRAGVYNTCHTPRPPTLRPATLRVRGPGGAT